MSAQLVLFAAAPVAADTVTLELTTECDTAAGFCRVDIAHRGDEAAQEIQVEIDAAGRVRSLPMLPALAPGATSSRRVELDPERLPPGRSPVTVHVRYRDEGGVPHSALSYAYLLRDPLPPDGALSAELSSVAIGRQAVAAHLRVEAEPDTGRITVRPILPDELSLRGPAVRRLAPAAGGAAELRLSIANESAFPGSSYAIFALLETTRNGVRDSLFVPATVRVLAPPRPTDRLWGPLLVVLGGLVVALAIGTLRDRNRALRPALHSTTGSDPDWLLDLLVLAILVVYLLAYLRPGLLLTPTIATGGDTASHYLTAELLAETLLPQGRILGWMQGNLAGYPIFQLYFPLPFLLMAGLRPLVGLPVAFKLVTTLGVLLTPVAAYLAFRCFGFRRPAPALAAVCTVPFLLNETNSVWGGNLPSTLAGEFSYSLGLALTLLFAGTTYRGMLRRRYWVANAVLLAAIGLSHAYALLLAGALSTAHLLWVPRPRAGLAYLARVYALAFCLIGFWIVPLLAYAPYGTPYRDVWQIDSWQTVLPPILWPFAVAAAVGAVMALVRVARRPATGGRRFDARLLVLGNLLWIGLALYLVAPKLGAVDIRFLPLVQLGIALLAAPVLAAIARRTRPVAVAVLLLAGGTLLGSDRLVAYIPQWVEWNYSGFERKPLWSVFARVNDAVTGGLGDPRVAFEHTPAHNAAGSIRAFESLPLFSGRSTLEGLYVQSAISAPEIFYLQSEYSAVASCPFPDYHCARLDLERAAGHLRQYNTGRLIARSETLKRALQRSDEFALEEAIPPYEVHRVVGNAGRYVVPLAHRPLMLTSGDWKRDFFRWFKRPGAADVVLVRGPLPATEEPGRFPLRFDGLPRGVPRVPLRAASRVVVEEEIGQQRIRIHTSAPGHPLLVRVSYHPRWRVRGADRIYLASPGFMLVFPEEEALTLEFANPPLVRLGHLLTALGGIFVVGVAGLGLGRRILRRRAFGAGRERAERGETVTLTPRRALVGAGLGVAVCLGAWASTGLGAQAYAPLLYERGLDAYKGKRFAEARSFFDRAVTANPLSSAALHASFYRALAAYREEHWRPAAELFDEMIQRFPESPYRAEAEYHIGLCFRRLGDHERAEASFREVVARFPGTDWSGFAAERLAEPRPEEARREKTESEYDREPDDD